MRNENERPYEIIEHIAVLKESPSGWKKELNIVAWNEGEPKFDIREWDKDYYRMSRGTTLTEEEMDILLDAVKCYKEAKEV